MSREKFFENYRELVINEESILLKQIEDFVIDSGLIVFDDVLLKPAVVSGIFKDANIINDLKIREGKEVGSLDEKADILIIFNRIKSDSTELRGSNFQIIVAPKDRDKAKLLIHQTLIDSDILTGYKDFFSEENKLQLVFSESKYGMFLSRMFLLSSSYDEDQ